MMKMFNSLNMQEVFDGSMQSVRAQLKSLKDDRARLDVKIAGLEDHIAANLEEGKKYGLVETPVNAKEWKD